MNNDLISRSELKKAFEITQYNDYDDLKRTESLIDNAPTVEYTFDEAFQKTVCENKLYCPARPQGEFVEKLKDRIEESVCKYCQINKHCELCEISRVFSIIALTDKDMKGGME